MSTTLQVAPSPEDATFMYMSDTVGIAELRQNLSKYLRKVAEGERLVVTDRNRPVAELGPPATTGSRLDQLIAEGKVKPPKRRGPLPPLLNIDLGDPDALARALEEVRGYR
jgi:prevent-host-death family protein